MHGQDVAPSPPEKAGIENGDVSSEVKVKDSSQGQSSKVKVILQLLVSLLCGFVFGAALEKSRVFEPKSIRLQMVFRRWIMLKMFLAAAATGQLGLAVLSLLPVTRARFQGALQEFTDTLTSKGLLTSLLGPTVLGVGMTLAGACPGMVLAQVGAWAPNSIFTLLGCLVGALIFGMVAPPIIRLTSPRKPYQYQHLHQKVDKPFALLAIPMAVLLAVVVFLLEFFIPYNTDHELERPDLLRYNIATTIAWPPFVGGILVGLLQVPLVLVVGDTMGGSSSYVTVMSQWVVTSRLQEIFPYLAAKRCGVGNWWQVVYVSGAILGGLVSAASSSSLATVQGVGGLEAFFGGLLMLLGARLAAGCTSGHGLSGMGLLTWLSLLAVPCMFGGAIATAFAMDSTGALTRLVNATGAF